jgi:hypothetical protein|tara:strand:+ start:676 stop:858 length:183 start_codon:yes stop_codon:yes gene_type:complete
MGLFEKAGNKGEKPSTAVIQLTQEELNIILQLIKNSNFNGDMIDSLYHLTTKLQSQYKGE